MCKFKVYYIRHTRICNNTLSLQRMHFYISPSCSLVFAVGNCSYGNPSQSPDLNPTAKIQMWNKSIV